MNTNKNNIINHIAFNDLKKEILSKYEGSTIIEMSAIDDFNTDTLIKLLKDKIKQLEKEQQPLIDLKNKYLSELRSKNLELGRLKKLGDKEND